MSQVQYAFLSADRKSIVYQSRQSRLKTPVGSFARETCVPPIGMVADLARRTDEELETMGIARIQPQGFDRDNYVLTGRTFTPNPDGTLKVSAGNLEEVLSLDAIPASGKLSRLADKMRKQIKQERDRHIRGGIEVAVGPDTYPVQTDDASQSKLTAAYNLAKDGYWVAPGNIWRMADNRVIGLTASDMQSIAVAVSGHVAVCFAVQANLEDAIDSILDDDTQTDDAKISTLQALDLMSGWPAILPEASGL